LNVKRILFSLVILTFLTINTKAQDGYIQQGEFGFTVGASHYFGDLNTRSGLNKPKPALGLFFRKQFGNYVGMRVAGRFAKLGYSDEYSKNDYQKTRNLSFETKVFEFAVHGDFNFFKYDPNDLNYGFTPYVTLGLGVFSFDPYATDTSGTRVYLQRIGTEGQNEGYLGRKPYNTMAICVPLGVGIKYSINKKVNLSFEISHRFTMTDYLDDVSTTYAPNYITSSQMGFQDCFPPDQNGTSNMISQYYLLQDRSWEIADPTLQDPSKRLSSQAGRQRGWSKQKDQYVIAEIGISFNIGSYRCPTAN